MPSSTWPSPSRVPQRRCCSACRPSRRSPRARSSAPSRSGGNGPHRGKRPWASRVDPLLLLLVFLKASALSIGGLSSLPLLRADLVAPGIATDEQVVQAIAIGRISTGPNGLYIVSLGYLVGGVAGATVALLAASLPPLVIVPITAFARRWLLAAPVAGLVRGVALATAGLLVATGMSIVTATGS